jgi:hypothetical protein
MAGLALPETGQFLIVFIQNLSKGVNHEQAN